MSLPSDPQQRDAFLLRCANGNEDATKFLLDIAIMARMADDLADRPELKGEQIVGDLLAKCLIDIPSHRFFRDNFSLLAPSINEMIVGWQISGEYKISGDFKKQTFGFVYREATDRVAVAVALITGGTAHSRNILRELFDVCHTSTETVADWVKS